MSFLLTVKQGLKKIRLILKRGIIIKKLVLILFLAFLSVGLYACSNQNGNKNNHYGASDTTGKDVREVVWNYIENQSWGNRYSKDDWDKATVKKVMVDNSYKNFDKKYIGKEVYAVTMQDATAAPTLFVDPENNKVIGYLPGS